MKIRYRVMLVIVLFAAGLCPALGAPVERNNLPIQIKSNELLTDNATRTATFVGKV
jgi:lipopolysaccharide export system protein LptA